MIPLGQRVKLPSIHHVFSIDANLTGINGGGRSN